jgi:hypothetical protein
MSAASVRRSCRNGSVQLLGERYDKTVRHSHTLGDVPLMVIGVALLTMLAFIALLPLTLIQRYRAGTSRQLARGWLAAVNLAGLAMSVLLFVIGAAVTSIWVPYAFRYTIAGIAFGCVLGVIGLVLTRWEPSSRSLYYTPNRWLVLAITLVVTTRLLYGFWRGWQSWRSASDGGAWVVASGATGALAAGAVVLGYYLTYWIGVRRQLSRHRRNVTVTRPRG